jgi:hypothetical protein
MAQRALEKKTGMTFAEQMADKAAKDAGFSNVAAQQANRMMRNQLEEKAARLGISNQEAYALAGNDLTNTQALQEAWNKLVAPPKKEEVVTEPNGTKKIEPGETGGTKPPEKSATDLLAEDFRNQIADLTETFRTNLGTQREQYEAMQAEQNERMTALQNQMLAAAQMRDRPTTAGVKMATGAAGTPMQIARRGVTGAFGRRGMRISSLNV